MSLCVDSQCGHAVASMRTQLESIPKHPKTSDRSTNNATFKHSLCVDYSPGQFGLGPESRRGGLVTSARPPYRILGLGPESRRGGLVSSHPCKAGSSAI